MAFSRTMQSLPVAQVGTSVRLGAAARGGCGRGGGNAMAILAGACFGAGAMSSRLGIVLDGPVCASAKGGGTGDAHRHASGEKECGAQRRHDGARQSNWNSVHMEHPRNSAGIIRDKHLGFTNDKCAWR